MTKKERYLAKLDPQLLLNAYCSGVFPMGMGNGEIGWFSPDPRGIIPLDRFHIPHGLDRTLKKRPFEIRINTAFRDVIKGCSERKETWIDDSIIESYCRLYDLGFAHSVEAWKNDELVGGLYGVSVGGAFFGESMFSRATDASKVALVHLIGRLRERRFLLLDTQWTTAHLKTMGAENIPKKEYMHLLTRALRAETRFEGDPYI
ncbi:MAG: leucyl/phenylalanyl-tRNA--protein transferase [Verrucomicrobia bacterium]|nr:leucyl/phenylalanyl-tRNA--protein transferase [Verrucomicrobiota bacterium]